MKEKYYVTGYILTPRKKGKEVKLNLLKNLNSKERTFINQTHLGNVTNAGSEDLIQFGASFKAWKDFLDDFFEEFVDVLIGTIAFSSTLYLESDDTEARFQVDFILDPLKMSTYGKGEGREDWNVYVEPLTRAT